MLLVYCPDMKIHSNRLVTFLKKISGKDISINKHIIHYFNMSVRNTIVSECLCINHLIFEMLANFFILQAYIWVVLDK